MTNVLNNGIIRKLPVFLNKSRFGNISNHVLGIHYVAVVEPLIQSGYNYLQF